MNPQHNKLEFSVPLTQKIHGVAQKFQNQQANAKKSQQVYLNTLAVYATNYYLECLGIETDLEASDSWNPVMQVLADVGDLVVKGQGKLECRYLLPEEDFFYVPPEVWQDRIGYVVIQLNQELTEATLLGYRPQVTTEKVSIQDLESLDNLLEILTVDEVEDAAIINQPIIKLSKWLEKKFEHGWQAVEEILQRPSNDLLFSFRGKHKLRKQPLNIVEGAKVLNLEKKGEEVALIMGLTPTENLEIDVSVQVYPAGKQTYLPRDLQLMVLDEGGDAVMQAQARSTKNIQLEFSGEPGEKFSVKVALGNVSVTEPFLI